VTSGVRCRRFGRSPDLLHLIHGFVARAGGARRNPRSDEIRPPASVLRWSRKQQRESRSGSHGRSRVVCLAGGCMPCWSSVGRHRTRSAMTRMNRWTVPRRRRPVCAVPAQRTACESGCRRTKGGEHPGAGHACDLARVFPDHLREMTRHPTIASGQAAGLSLSGWLCQARCSS
jgi:hypothetical protein